MKRTNIAAIAKADDKPRAAAIEMIKTPLWLIEQILLKHETAAIEVMKELHDENMRLRKGLRRIADMLDRDGNAIEIHRDELRGIARAVLQKVGDGGTAHHCEDALDMVNVKAVGLDAAGGQSHTSDGLCGNGLERGEA